MHSQVKTNGFIVEEHGIILRVIRVVLISLYSSVKKHNLKKTEVQILVTKL